MSPLGGVCARCSALLSLSLSLISAALVALALFAALHFYLCTSAFSAGMIPCEAPLQVVHSDTSALKFVLAAVSVTLLLVFYMHSHLRLDKLKCAL